LMFNFCPPASGRNPQWGQPPPCAARAG
jgi:hypothetical protein